jgi:hypothetical protein
VTVNTAALDAADAGTLDASATRNWLARAAVPYVASEVAGSGPAAGDVADRLGYPVAAKLVLPGLVHKSDAGGVALGLTSRAAVERACREMTASAPAGTSGEPAFEIQRMVSGTEVIVGMMQDPTWGPIVMVGSGGVFAEITHDVAWDLPPLSTARARAMIERLQGFPLLSGARGRPPADAGALAELLVRFADAVAESPGQFQGIDLNPVLVGAEGEGACAVDAVLLRPVVASTGAADS